MYIEGGVRTQQPRQHVLVVSVAQRPLRVRDIHVATPDVQCYRNR